MGFILRRSLRWSSLLVLLGLLACQSSPSSTGDEKNAPPPGAMSRPLY
jgi:hypothetical protein